MKTTLRLIVSGMILLGLSATGSAEIVRTSWDNVLYRYERDNSYSGPWEIYGTTLPSDSTDRTLYIIRGSFTHIFWNDSWVPDTDHIIPKVFSREAFAWNDFVTGVAPYSQYYEAEGWCESKAFYHASALDEFQLKSSGYAQEDTPSDSVFMYSSVRRINCTPSEYAWNNSGGWMSIGKHFAAETKNLNFCRIYVKSFGEEAFRNSAVEYLHITSSQSYIPAGFCEGASNLYDFCYNCQYTEVEEIGERAFKGCNLSDLDNSNAQYSLMKYVKVIGDYAFDGCPTTALVWSDRLEKIGKYAFRGSKFSEVYLAPSITHIGEGAFAGNENLREVYISNPEPPSIVWDAADPSKCSIPVGVTIHVPWYAVDVYKTTPDAAGEMVWTNYEIEPITDRYLSDGEWTWGGARYSGETTYVDYRKRYEMLGLTEQATRPLTIDVPSGFPLHSTANGLTFYYPDSNDSFNVMISSGRFAEDSVVTTLNSPKASISFAENAFRGSVIENVRASGYIHGNAFKDSRLRSFSGSIVVFENGFRDTPDLVDFSSKSVCIRGSHAFHNSGITELTGLLNNQDLSGEDCEFQESTFEDSKLQKLTGANDSVVELRCHKVGQRAFKNAPLEVLKATWPNLKTIAEEAFAGTNLADFDWGDKLTSIGRNAFAGTRFEKIYFPTSLWSIEEGAFAGCEQLTDVWSLAMVPPSIVWDDDNPERCSLPPGITVHTLPEYAKFYQGDPAWKHYIILGDGDTTAIDSVEADRAGKSIHVEEGRIVADGLVEVFTVDGRLLASGYAASLPTLPAGLYIVRTPAATAKIAIR